MPTALELGQRGWQPYLDAVTKLPDLPLPAAEDEAARKELIQRARQLASTLRERFAVDRVILFGSLVHAAWFTPDSDVDLAVEGLTGRDYWMAWRLAEEAFGDRSVDLVDLAEASDSLRAVIEKSGEPV